MNDSLGNRMKRYENVNRHFLIPKLPVIIRLDGKTFHTFTKNCKKPFDDSINHAFVTSTAQLVSQIQGCSLAYHQSDEVSFLITDFSNLDAELWFAGNIQKICSVSSSMMTAYFNSNYKRSDHKLAFFDCRVFQLPNNVEVVNYFRWRNKDCYRNAISSIAQTLFSDKELHGKSTVQRLNMIKDKAQPEDLNKLFGNVIESNKEIIWHDGWDFVTDNGKLAAMIPEINYEK